ncbi:hypothetical protein [Streptomyces sp. NPDC002324]
MTDTGAVYGLLGALGGAGIAGLAAIYGPTLLHRRQAEQRMGEERTRRREAETTRLLKVRTTGRAWIDVLERTVQDLQAPHRPVDVDRFDEVVDRVAAEATEAGHALAHSGLWLQSQDTPPHGIPSVWATPGGPGPGDGDSSASAALSQLLGRLREATREVRSELLRSAVQPRGPLRHEVLEALERVRAARAQLNAVLLEEIAHLDEGRMRRT